MGLQVPERGAETCKLGSQCSVALGDKLIAFAFQTTLAPVHALHFDSEVALVHEEVWIHGQRYPV